LAAGRVQVDYVRSERAWLHPGQSAEILVMDNRLVIWVVYIHL
jgi:phenylalanyl-tRNA synthetase beta subunit